MSPKQPSVGLLTAVVRRLRVVVFFLITPLYLLAIIAVALLTKDVGYWYPIGRNWAQHSLWLFRIRVEVFGRARIEPGRDYYYYVESISLDGRRRRFTPVIHAPKKGVGGASLQPADRRSRRATAFADAR